MTIPILIVLWLIIGATGFVYWWNRFDPSVKPQPPTMFEILRAAPWGIFVWIVGYITNELMGWGE